MTPPAFRSETEGGGTGMAAKILKYAALPAAVVGLGSLRIYSINEKKNVELISPRELSIYSPDAPAVQFVEEQPGVLQTGLGVVRVGLQSYVRSMQSAYTSVKFGVISVYQAGQDTYHFLRDPPPGFLPRVGVISVSGLGGLILARKGSRLKRIVVPLGLATAGTAVCYPTQTVAVLKITGKKVYTVSSSVASILKSKPKEDVIMPAVSVESAAAVTIPDTESPVKALSELSSESEPAPAVSDEEVTPISEAKSVELSSVADIVSDDAVEPPSIFDLTTGIASLLPEPESPPALEIAPVAETTSEPVDGTVLNAESTPESTLEPVAETVKESTPELPLPEPAVKTAPEATPADCMIDTDPEPTLSTETDVIPLTESDPEIVPESAPTSPELEDPTPTIVIEEATPSTSSTVEETTPPAPAVSDEEVSPISEAKSVELSSVADIVSDNAVEPPIVDLTTGIASPLPEPESPPALETAPVTETTSEPVDGTVRDAETTPESTLEPVAETVKESTPELPLPEPAVKTAPPADCMIDTDPEPTLSTETDVIPLVESDPEIVPESAPTSPELEDPTPTIVIEEATPSTTSIVEETTPPAPILPILPEEVTTTTVDEGPASVSPPPAEEAIPLTPPPTEEASLSSEPPVVEPATVKSRFVPDPSLLDHGQSNPEDADMYSTRS